MASSKKRGQPPKQYNPKHAKQVQAMSQYGVPQEDIAATIGVCVPTMLKLYDAEYRKGKATANAKVGKRLFERCESGDTTALIFWAKTRMGWRENNQTSDTERLLDYIHNYEEKRAAAKNPVKTRNLKDLENG
ncbi:MAG: hypothetical protein FWF99_00125 [Desulfovibrionaceae bacterium]|nr:hypothetical protein [Desulfovibrionaceae bacterium]